MEEAKAGQLKSSQPNSMAIEDLRATFDPLRGTGGSGIDKKVLMCQAECVGRRWFGCGGHFEGESM